MATNNAVNLSGSGAVKYDGAGTFSAVSVPLTVPNEGTGNSSLTTYAVLTGGTTTTGNVQSIASVGSAAQVLTSNGSSALPTMQTQPTAVEHFYFNVNTTFWSPSDSATYYMVPSGTFNLTDSSASMRIYIPNAGTIQSVVGCVTNGGAVGTSENVTIAVRVNDTTNTNVTTSAQWDQTENPFSNTGLSISVSAGDYIEMMVITPAWVTNPFAVYFSCGIYGVYT